MGLRSGRACLRGLQRKWMRVDKPSRRVTGSPHTLHGLFVEVDIVLGRERFDLIEEVGKLIGI